MVRRETDASLINRIANDPECFGNVSYDGRAIDFAPYVDDLVILSNGEDACQVFEQRAQGVWEVMTIFAPSCRGKRALETARAMRDWMAPYVDVAFGWIPDRLRAAKWFYRQIGGKPCLHLAPGGFEIEPRDGEQLFIFEGAR